MAKKVGIIKAPDGFYIGSINKNGLPSADSRKITDDEITFMFEDLVRRHKAETGKSVKVFFHKRVPTLIAKVDPTLEECGIVTPRMKAALQAKAQQQPKGLRIGVPK